MVRSSPWPALTAVLLVACAAPPAAESPTAPPEPVVVAAPSEKDSEDGPAEHAESSDDAALFLWTVAVEDEPQTYWVESVQGKATERGAVSGVVVAAAGQVWQWKTESEAVATAPCTGLGPGVDAPSGGQAQRGWFEPVGGASPRQVVLEATRKSELSSFEEWVHPVGSAGPFLFIRLHQQAYACGAAHGGHSSAVFIWDLGRGERAQVDFGEFDSPELRDAAYDQLREHALDESQGASGLHLRALVPIYDQRGHLSLGRVYVTDACYACSDAWGSYLRGATIPGPPPRWEGVRTRAPELVSAFLRQHPRLTLRGWSRAPHLEAARAAVRRLFAAALHTSRERPPQRGAVRSGAQPCAHGRTSPKTPSCGPARVASALDGSGDPAKKTDSSLSAPETRAGLSAGSGETPGGPWQQRRSRVWSSKVSSPPSTVDATR